MSRKSFRCFTCGDVDAIDGHTDMLCEHCGDVCDTVWMCSVCDSEEAHLGCSECLDCLVAAIVADPRELDSCSPDLVVEIARELAKRVQPEQRVAA